MKSFIYKKFNKKISLKINIFRLAVLFISLSPSAYAQTCAFNSTKFNDYPYRNPTNIDLIQTIYQLPQGMRADTDIGRPIKSNWLDYNNEGLQECKKIANNELNCSGFEMMSNMDWLYSKTGQSYKINYHSQDKTLYCHMKLDNKIGPAVVFDIVRTGIFRGNSVKTLIRNIYPVTFHVDDF